MLVPHVPGRVPPGKPRWEPGDRRSAVLSRFSCRHAAWSLACALLIFSMGCSRPGPRTVDLRELLRAAEDGRQPLPQDPKLSPADPSWPIYKFLSAEAWLARGEAHKARFGYSALCGWAAKDPNHDLWGASALAAPALWRWISLLSKEAAPPRDEVNLVLAIEKQLLQARLVRRMFFDDPVFGGIDSLPQLEEEIARRLAVLARRVGRKEDAERLFLDYLALASSPGLSAEEEQLKNDLIASRLAAPDRLVLMRGKRLADLLHFAEAYPLLEEASRSSDLQVQVEASLYLARVAKTRKAPHDKIVEILSPVIERATGPDVVQQALRDRASEYRDMRRYDLALRDLDRLIREFPDGDLADHALWTEADIYASTGDTTKALQCLDRLRHWTGPNNFVSMAPFRQAMLLYVAGGADQRRQASEILEELNRALPSGDLQRNALFWLGRMAEESGQQTPAAGRFQSLVKEAPYDYYAIRARMHLRLGAAAAQQFLPDSATEQELRAAYQQSSLDATLGPESFYMARLREAIQTGLYAECLRGDRRFRAAFPSRRLQDVSTAELDGARLLPSLVLWLARRQDALAVKDSSPDVEQRLRIAASVGKWAGDWPLAVSLTMTLHEPRHLIASLQADPHYLATAYPPLFVEQISEAVGKYKKYKVPPELLYSVMRNESLFSPDALSRVGAFGLFQFLPDTFRGLDVTWHLLQPGGAPSMDAFLLDPERSIDLAARWLGQELLPPYRKALPLYQGSILLAVMGHQAGLGYVAGWMADWKTQGRLGDIEFMVETAGMSETRIFAREVFSTLAIAKAAGIVRPQERAKP